MSVIGLASVGDEGSAEESIATLRFAHRIVRTAKGGQVQQQAVRPAEQVVRPEARSEQVVRPDRAHELQQVVRPDQPSRQRPNEVRTGIVDGAGSTRDELAKAWAYAFAMENLVAWMVEVFQVGGW